MLFAAKGKEAAFDELYKRYSKKMLFFFYQRLYQDNEKAQDFLQDLFLKIIEKPELFDSQKIFSSWIYSMADNMCKNEYRKNSVRGTKATDFDLSTIMDEKPFVNLPDQYDVNLFRDSLNKELNSMEESQSLAFILRHQENLSIKEIAEIMECSEGTVKSRLFYTVKKLSARLQLFNTHQELSHGK